MQPLIKYIEYSYTLYLVPNLDKPDCLKKWKQSCTHITHLIEPNRIKDINEWRNSKKWQEAAQDYNFLYQKNKEHFDEKLTKDICNYKKRLNKSELCIEEHLINEAKDCLSFLYKKQDEPFKITVVLYPHSLPFIMAYCLRKSKDVGYSTNFIHVKTKLEDVTVNANTAFFDHNKEQSQSVITYDAGIRRNTI